VATSPISGIVKSEGTGIIGDDPNVVILKTFEDTTRRSSSTGRMAQISPTSEISDPFCSLSLSPILDSLPSPVIFDDDQPSFIVESCLDQHQPSQDSTLFAHFRHVVWKQLFPHDRGQDDSFGLETHGMTLSVDFLEREAAHFPPVSIVSHSYLVVPTLIRMYSFPMPSWPCQLSVSHTTAADRVSMRCSITSRHFHLSRSVSATTMTSSPMDYSSPISSF
jgi:hypothetical protein